MTAKASRSDAPPSPISSRLWFVLALLKDELEPLIAQGLAAAIYTQLADVEIEFNGFLTYDRAVPKMDERRIAKAHRTLCRALG